MDIAHSCDRPVIKILSRHLASAHWAAVNIRPVKPSKMYGRYILHRQYRRSGRRRQRGDTGKSFFSAERVCIYKALSRSPGYFFIWTKRRKTLRENIFVPKPIFVTSTLWNVDVSSDFAMHTCVRITKSWLNQKQSIVYMRCREVIVITRRHVVGMLKMTKTELKCGHLKILMQELFACRLFRLVYNSPIYTQQFASISKFTT